MNEQKIDTRQRVITATITVKPYTHVPGDQSKVAGYRHRDLKNWLERHEKDIKNEMAGMDDVEIDIDISVEEEQ